MKSKVSLELLLFIICSVVLIFSSIIIFFLTENKPIVYPAHVALAEQVNAKKVGSGLPVRLKIPKINVDAPIDSVGLTANGSMDVPLGPDGTGWFDLGVHPGEIGNAVIDGHAGWKNNIPAVFDNLYKLGIGDKLYVTDEKGITITFMVRKIRTFKGNDDASEVFFSHDGEAHLNLITCTGIWNNITKSSSDRLVVFADKMTK